MRVDCPRTAAEDILNIMWENNIISWDYFEADERFFFSVSQWEYRRLCAVFPHPEQMQPTQCGLWNLLSHLWRRPGLLVGAVAACLVMVMGSLVVWEVRVEGEERIPVEKIKTALAESGLSVGMPLSSLDRAGISAEVLQREPELAYIGINIKGNVVYVEVRERQSAPGEDGQEKEGGANLVASCDAIIDSLAVRTGDAVVHTGQVVRAGQLLVSGVTNSHAGNKFVYAEGEVFGRVQQTFTVTLPRDLVLTRVEERQLSGISLIFWGKNINIYGGTGNLPAGYDTIYTKDPIYLFGYIRLPITVIRTESVRYAEDTIHLTESETVSYAMRLMEERLMRELADGELLRRRYSGAFVGEEYILTCEVECIRNIAVTSEFGIG